MAPRLQIGSQLFAEMLTELARRGDGTRESGAFLLADAAKAENRLGTTEVVAVAYYDDLDPCSLTGGITFGADGYTALGDLCRTRRLTVAADVHTHPFGSVNQSPTDAAHPMVAIPGHMAIIIPNFAKGPIGITDLGVHEFLGQGAWTSAYAAHVGQCLAVGSQQQQQQQQQQSVRATWDRIWQTIRRLTGRRSHR